MAPALNTYRQTENDSRLQYMRSVPVYPGTSDQLMAVEKWLWDSPCLPARALVGNEFPEIKTDALNKLAHVQQCCEAIVHLRYVTEHQLENTAQLATIEKAANVYAQELQRLLGSVFHLDDPFWEQYYKRLNNVFYIRKPISPEFTAATPPSLSPLYLQQHYGLFFITLDAIHHCTGLGNSLAYQLLLQSMKWVLTGYYLQQPTKAIERKTAFHNATQLVESLDLADYKEWLGWL